MFKEEHVLLNADEYIKLVSKICEKESKLENILCADPNDFLYFLGGNFNNINKVSFVSTNYYLLTRI